VTTAAMLSLVEHMECIDCRGRARRHGQLLRSSISRRRTVRDPVAAYEWVERLQRGALAIMTGQRMMSG